jgi:hypothetical protein
LKTFARRIINRAWIAACSREQARFSRALERIEETQSRYLLDLLRRNARTQFGEKHNFSIIATVAEYQQRVPQNPYETLAPYIEAIARGETNVLTADPVRLFQPTSGSTSGTKLIPWTDAVAREFRRGINPWLAALYQRQPALLNGTAYWSISPPIAPQRTCGRLRVGFDHDADYLGFLGRKLFSLVSAVPAEVERCHDMVEFRTRTLLHLLADENLRLISVWSPTFLTVLLEDFVERQDEILPMLSRCGLFGARRRSEVLKAIARESRRSFKFEQAWPNLKVISCWTHGSSAIYAENLRRYFPGVEIQGKGLVATEAFVSLPFREGSDPVLAVTSHFVEFQNPDTNTIFLAHQLAAGKEYQVIVTTGGGLYRYPLGDRIRVTGFIHGAPCCQFISREGLVSDLFGEKLNAGFVEKVTCRAIAQQNIEPRFFLLAPVADIRFGTSYTLFIETDSIPNPAGLRHHLEHGLAENFHYSHCRNLGQISPARLFHIQPATPSASSVFLQEMQARGIKAGNAKVTPLDGHFGWERRFHGKFIS